MSRFIRELFQGSSYRHHPRYYYDDAVVSYGAGRTMLPDVVLHVPMETMRDVERVKQALAIEGVHRVRCDMASQTVVVSGNVPPHTLLRRVKWIKRHSSLMSYGAAPSAYGGTQLYVDPGAELVPAYNPYSTGGVAGELPPPVYTPYSTGVVYEPRPGNLLEYDVGYERPYSSSYSYY